VRAGEVHSALLRSFVSVGSALYIDLDGIVPSVLLKSKGDWTVLTSGEQFKGVLQELISVNGQFRVAVLNSVNTLESIVRADSDQRSWTREHFRTMLLLTEILKGYTRSVSFVRVEPEQPDSRYLRNSVLLKLYRSIGDIWQVYSGRIRGDLEFKRI
jgi:hypothetical protein